MNIRTETSRENVGQGIDDEQYNENYDSIFGKAWYEKDEYNAYATFETDEDSEGARAILERRIRRYYDGEIRYEYVNGHIRGWYVAPEGHFDKMKKVNK